MKLIVIFEEFANEYCIEFNGSKSKMIIFSKYPIQDAMKSFVKVNNVNVPIKEYVIHLGNKLSGKLNESNIGHITANFYT